MLANSLIYGVLITLHYAIQAYILLVFVACVLSFIRPNPFNKFVQAIYKLTTPAFKLVRRYIPTTLGGFDFAPLVILIGLSVIDNAIIYALQRSVF
ncbi:YggT family protein [Campylobacter sp. JMF_01 NE2]|uniref:YggT family protein n=1 Tax=unclassified Campylobacter TaxID=2593542 RepID=UPI0022E999CF|nr:MULTISPECIES: YggT family protein [unclassified Campylobacter]MDA3043434.1 YggT family protein [Campylobacter sp. JMF_09 ED2]MDA3045188.1 YggT family protein [Campylobacter sp. JMF_07 ED4]MDA3046096.1 YggT family protein [Campylobacter sp. VBCF_06 NA8]MDA3048184.1 YggT family protein [Campylobacter sp. JMF_08 NE1]MDA3048877.1 YggT family protein [Campylobacter sp. JMF_15 NE4]